MFKIICKQQHRLVCSWKVPLYGRSQTVVYHAQFVRVPDHLLRLIQRRITAFLLGLGCIRRDDDRVLVSRPAAAVASLPTKMGGIGQVDVAAHITAMQAKVAVALCTSCSLATVSN
jgi:hypothetical protein